MDIDVSGAFAEIIGAAPRTAETIATNTHGKAWTKGHEGPLRPGATYHGVRHSVASLARDLGASDGETAAAINDESAAVGARYGREALRGSRLRSAVVEQVKIARIGKRIGKRARFQPGRCPQAQGGGQRKRLILKGKSGGQRGDATTKLFQRLNAMDSQRSFQRIPMRYKRSPNAKKR